MAQRLGSCSHGGSFDSRGDEHCDVTRVPPGLISKSGGFLLPLHEPMLRQARPNTAKKRAKYGDASTMRLRRPSGTLWFAAVAALATGACATTPASAPASAPTPSTPAAPSAAPTPAAAAERPAAFAVCAACHGATANAAPTIGPNLFGVAGKPAGTAHPDYEYSAALKASGKVWTTENLAAFLQDPSTFIPGNNMDYPGVSDAAAAKSIADYMATLR